MGDLFETVADSSSSFHHLERKKVRKSPIRDVGMKSALFHFLASAAFANHIGRMNARNTQEQEAIHCWTCDANTLEDCNAHGRTQQCNQGQVCAVTVRKRGFQYDKIILGCKQKQACQTNRDMNFHGPFPHQYQCKLNPANQHEHSVCRQCCYAAHCFAYNGLSARNGIIKWDEFTDQMWSNELKFPSMNGNKDATETTNDE